MRLKYNEIKTLIIISFNLKLHVMYEEKIFNENDFVKRTLSSGDIFSFDDFVKPEFNVAKVVLTWETASEEPDLDLAAIMLNNNGRVSKKEDLVYFKSSRRWKPELPMDSCEFDPLKGTVSEFEKDKQNFKNKEEWQAQTLPLSLDNSVIGSWDDRGDTDGPSEERLHVRFKEIDTRNYSAVAIIATISMDDIQKGYTFKDVFNPIVKILDANDDRVLAEYKLNENFQNSDGVCVGYLQFNNIKNSWEFEAKKIEYNGGMLKVANSFC